jgi:hypothetical protein
MGSAPDTVSLRFLAAICAFEKAQESLNAPPDRSVSEARRGRQRAHTTILDANRRDAVDRLLSFALLFALVGNLFRALLIKESLQNSAKAAQLADLQAIFTARY